MVVYNDDSETGTDSRITARGRRRHTIEATTFLGGETGQFTLTLVASQSGNSTFTDHPLVAGSTPIRAAHMNELRDRIGGLRWRTTCRGPGTDVPIQPGVTPVKAVHLMELRAAVDETYPGGSLRAGIHRGHGDGGRDRYSSRRHHGTARGGATLGVCRDAAERGS